MSFRQAQNHKYEISAIELRINILSDEMVKLRGFVKELMLVVDHLRQKVESVPGEETEKQEEKERIERIEREEKEKVEKVEKERAKKKSKFYSIISMAGIFSLIGAGILWKKM